MKHPERITDSLRDMLVACNRVAATVAGMTKLDFENRWSAQEVIVRQIITVGEAVKRIRHADPDFFVSQDVLAPIPVVGMRNHVIHQYDDVDLNVVWTTASVSFPELRNKLVPLLLDLDPLTDLDSLHF